MVMWQDGVGCLGLGDVVVGLVLVCFVVVARVVLSSVDLWLVDSLDLVLAFVDLGLGTPVLVERDEDLTVLDEALETTRQESAVAEGVDVAGPSS